VMSWAKLNDLLGQATIWSQHSLVLMLDTEFVPAARYCAPATGRDGGQVQRPDPDKVKDFLRRGATLVANDIDHLSPSLTAFADALERALGGKVQANLYLSSRRRQGFGAHFDTHDVYAVHVEGTKTWHVYEGREQDPIWHQLFKKLGREYLEKAKGRKLMDVHMEPGDLLYLPRGQYHDALADEGGTVHVAFGVVYPIGLDVVSQLFEWAVAEPEFRANLPRQSGPHAALALAERLALLGDRIHAILTEPTTAAKIAAQQRGFGYPRHTYALPDLLGDPADTRFRVRAKGIRLVQQGGRYGLVQEGSRAATEVPADVSPMVSWVLERREFSRTELAAAFPGRQATQLDQLLRDLGAMRLTEPA
jgi:bifunctional lysine-specific demethylase and histidyl-hydroxylase MINA